MVKRSRLTRFCESGSVLLELPLKRRGGGARCSFGFGSCKGYVANDFNLGAERAELCIFGRRLQGGLIVVVRPLGSVLLTQTAPGRHEIVSRYNVSNGFFLCCLRCILRGIFTGVELRHLQRHLQCLETDVKTYRQCEDEKEHSKRGHFLWRRRRWRNHPGCGVQDVEHNGLGYRRGGSGHDDEDGVGL